jgi:hypothetical protein
MRGLFMSSWVHRMLAVDVIKQQGICQKCGPVGVIKKRNSHGGFRYLCRVSQQKWKGRGKTLKSVNVTYNQYDEYLYSIGRMCEICGCAVRDKVCVDHCHSSLKFRGILCNNCKVAIGLMKDDLEILRHAISYLKRKPPTI